MYLFSFSVIFFSSVICFICIFESKAGLAQGEVADYDTAALSCYLDGELAGRDLGSLKLGQRYWIGGKRVELGCPRKGYCSRLEIGKTVRSLTQSLDFICVKRSQSVGLTRMAVQCADSYDVASITSYRDINDLYNRSLFPINRTMIIKNFNISGFLTKCKTVVRTDNGVNCTYHDCGSSLPFLCNNATGFGDLLTTLTITEYKVKATTDGRAPVVRDFSVSDSSTPDKVTASEPTNNSLPEVKDLPRIPDKNEISLFGLGLSAVHLLSIGTALVLTFIVLLVIICVLVRRNRRHRKTRNDPPSVKDNENEYASWFSSKEQLTEGSKGSGHEGSHYMTIPADMEYQQLDVITFPESHVYSSVSTPVERTRVFGRDVISSHR